MPSPIRFMARAALLLASTELACAWAQAQAVTLVHDLEALQAMRAQPQGHYALARSIDASATVGWNHGAGFAPIGTGAVPFTGSFDGRGHSIRQLFIHRPGENQVGLFGHARNATLRNVRLSGGRITGGNHVGALVGHNEAVDGKARIEQVCAEVSVKGAENVAGLVGHNEAYNGSNLVSRAKAGGPVAGTGSNVGGLVGHNEAYGGRADIALPCVGGGRRPRLCGRPGRLQRCPARRCGHLAQLCRRRRACRRCGCRRIGRAGHP